MKKLGLIVLSLLTALTFAGCASYTPPRGEGGGPSTNSGNNSYSDKDYVVILVSDGQPYSPQTEISAQWTGEDGIHSAKFDDNGVAVIGGLDGEYHVTLSSVPEGYTYDCNGYVADIHNKHIEVELMKLIPTTGNGSGLYQCIRITKLGTYRTTLTSATHKVYYEYKPTSQGQYSITSWVDTTQNQVNPKMIFYTGTSSWKNTENPNIYDDGGSSSTFTKNFRFIVEAAESDVSKSETQGNVWSFGVYADAVRGKEYPITVDFTIKFEANYVRPEDRYEAVKPTGNLKNIRPSGTFRYNYVGNGRLLDSKRFFLNPDDGYYHLVESPDKILFAMISKDCEVFASTDSGNGFLDELIYGRLYWDGKSYMSFINAYAEKCNSDGAHPVTEELKKFLQEYATSEVGLLFMDGNGIAETKTKLKSAEDDQWLFACGYYS